MKKTLVALSLTAGLLVAAPGIPTVQAQGPGGPGGPGGGGMRNRNSPKMRLGGLWRGIGEIEKSNTPLTKAQAKKVVALVRPWGSRPKMTDGQAKSLYMGLNNVLTAQQKNQLDKMAAMRRRTERGDRGDGPRGGGPGGPGGRGPGGPGGPGGFDPQRMRQTMQKMQGFMKTMNPFYPPSKYSEIKSLPERMRQGMSRRFQSSRNTLTALARKAA